MPHAILVDNIGSARTPYVVSFKPRASGSAIQKVIIASRSSGGGRGNRRIADLVNFTSWFQTEADERGWDLTVYNDVVSPASDGTAVPGATNNAVSLSSAAGSATRLDRRLRATRTTNLDSLRGRERIFLRARASQADHVWKLQGRSSPSLADPAIKPNDVVTFAPGATTYREVDLGDIEFPYEGQLVGAAIEIWAQFISGTAGTLFLDLVRLLPSGVEDVLTSLVAPAGSTEITLGKDLATPVTQPAAGTAGTVIGDSLQLDTTSDNCGVPPNSGVPLAAGLHRFTFKLSNQFPDPPESMLIALRDITANAYEVSQTAIIPATSSKEFVLEALISDANLYQAQVDNPSAANNYVDWIKHEFIPSAALDQTIRADPHLDKLTVDHLDTATPPSLIGEWEAVGPVPVWLPPGLAAVFGIPLGVGGESLENMNGVLRVEGGPRRYT
jgi:hypothetical protein